jgi:hypothetical protein
MSVFGSNVGTCLVISHASIIVRVRVAQMICIFVPYSLTMHIKSEVNGGSFIN